MLINSAKRRSSPCTTKSTKVKGLNEGEFELPKDLTPQHDDTIVVLSKQMDQPEGKQGAVGSGSSLKLHRNQSAEIGDQS